MEHTLSDKICYFVNTGTIGDSIASAAVVKYAIAKFHTPKKIDYKVAIVKHLSPFYHFVPNENLIYIRPNETELPDLDGYVFKNLIEILWPHSININGEAFNLDKRRKYEEIGVNSMYLATRTHTLQNPAIRLLSRIIDIKELPYVEVDYLPVNNFDIDFDKSVIIAASYNDPLRTWKNDAIEKIIDEVISIGLIPVFTGTSDKESKINFKYLDRGINLVNKTNLQELASIMNKSRAVITMDSGQTHVAFTTQVPIICGFTVVRPEVRIPYRKNAITIPIVPEESKCRFCQSDWNIDTKAICPRMLKNPECVDTMTAEKFIAALRIVTGR